MKDVFAVVLNKRQISRTLHVLSETAIRQLPMDTVEVYNSFDEARAVLEKKQRTGFIYELSCYSETESIASGIRPSKDMQNGNIQTSDIIAIKSRCCLYFEFDEIIPLNIPPVIEEKKLALFNSLRLLSWCGHQCSQFQEIFATSGMLDYVREIEKNASGFPNMDEYAKTLDKLHAALQHLIARIGIDSTGKVLPGKIGNQEHNHRIFQLQLNELGLTSSSSKLFQKLAFALLAVSLILTTTTLVVGAAPIEFTVVPVAALATSLRLFSLAKKDLGYRCEQALINVSAACCPTLQ